MVPYTHRALKDPSSEIRLVVLHPGHRVDPIKVTVSHVPLGAEAGSQKFEALSYTWGNPSLKTPITINDLSFDITINLECALRHLRQERSYRTLWIDAVCIQQLDAEERDQQIRIMGSIYSKASTVVVWLGPEAEDSCLALDAIGAGFCQRMIGREMTDISLPESSAQLQSTRQFTAVAALFDRAWWRRGWIIQEVLERKKVTLHCGRAAIPWEKVCTTVEIFEGMSWRTIRSRQLLGHIQMRTNNTLWDHLAMSIIPARLLFRLQGLDLDGWLHSLRFFNTTDPRDKFWIAAILAGRNLLEESHSPQYYGSLAQTYSFVASHLLETRKDLGLLEHCVFDARSVLPSWIPDWRVPKNAPISDWRFNNTASLYTDLVYEISDETLHLKGFILDAVQIFPPILLKEERINVESLLCEAANLDAIYAPTNELSKTALVRTVHGDLAHDVQEAYIYLIATSDEREVLEVPLALPEVKDVNELDLFVHMFFVKQRYSSKYAFTGRKYFRSRTGYIGLVPDATQEGDKICVFFGGDTPFVIRPSGDKYLLIGACYVHGIMKGEAMIAFEERGGVPENFFII